MLKLIKDNNLTCNTLQSFHKGILTCAVSCNNPCNLDNHHKCISLDIESERIINFSNDIEREYRGVRFDIPPLDAILAFIALKNSSHNKTLLSALKQSTLVQNLPENYKNQLLKKIESQEGIAQLNHTIIPITLHAAYNKLYIFFLYKSKLRKS